MADAKRRLSVYPAGGRAMRKFLLLALLILSLPLGSNGSAALEEINPFVRGSWKHILNAHAGQPTVVHFWGVTCGGPAGSKCRAGASFLKERPDLNLAVINADLVLNETKAVSAMLAETGLARAENWMFIDGFVERL